MGGSEGRRPPRVVAANFDAPVFLGEGGMGEVWQARERAGGATVAVKVVRAALLARPEVVARFRREISAMQRCRHRGVVGLRRVVEHEGELALVLDFIDGVNLANLVAKGPLDAPVVLRLARELSSALGAVHAAGLVHRDLKPENVMLRGDGSVVLMDFGLAAFSDPSEVTAMTKTGQVLGTFMYVAPEVLMGERATAWSDQYALGLVLHQCLTGEFPFTGSDLAALAQRKVSGTIRPFRGPWEEVVDPVLRGVVERCLALEPQDRFANMAAFARALSGGRRGRSPVMVAAGVLAVVLVVGGAGLYALRHRPDPPEPPSPPSTPVASSPSVEEAEAARQAWLRALDLLMESALPRASDPSLRRPAPGVDAAWAHERILERMGPLPDVDRAQRTMEGLARERDRMLGLLDLALRGPRLSGDEAHRAWLAYELRLDEFAHVLRKFERYALRRNATWVEAATKAKAVSLGLMDELLALEARQLAVSEVPPEFVLAVVNCLQNSVRPMEAARRLTRVDGELQAPTVGIWYPVLRLRYLNELRRLRLREGEWRESCSLMDDAEALVRGMKGPDEVLLAARTDLLTLLRDGLEGLVRGRLLPAEALQEGVVRMRRVLAAYAQPGWVDLLHRPLLEALDDMGQEGEAGRLRAQYESLLARKGAGR